MWRGKSRSILGNLTCLEVERPLGEVVLLRIRCRGEINGKKKNLDIDKAAMRHRTFCPQKDLRVEHEAVAAMLSHDGRFSFIEGRLHK